MLDLSSKWPRPPDWTAAHMHCAGTEVRCRSVGAQVLVSGPMERIGVTFPGFGAPACLLEAVAGDSYAVRIARDRVLLVGPAADDLVSGWHPAGLAITRMDAGLLAFEAKGEGTEGIMARGMAVDLGTRSPSAAAGFAGFEALIYRHGPEQRLRIHVSRTLAASLWTWFQTVAAQSA
jgi:hypothetical protein